MFNQGVLLPVEVCAKRSVCRDAIKANFTELGTSRYEVLLEVSSNKFLVNMIKDENGIHSFEIITVKGFMEITTKIIDVLKRLIAHLWEMVD
ncbi:MAG: hypothetical protein LBD75_08275 [Candidatus Peribacteria bacterium]|jgi:hypothetical protein|nr:hypothetical protein [Candidatus Peribacteria bacterium]